MPNYNNAKEKEVFREVYDLHDMEQILGIKRTAAYTFIQKVYRLQEPFRVLKIGSVYRIPKAGFDRWLDGNDHKSTNS